MIATESTVTPSAYAEKYRRADFDAGNTCKLPLRRP